MAFLELRVLHDPLTPPASDGAWPAAAVHVAQGDTDTTGNPSNMPAARRRRRHTGTNATVHHHDAGKPLKTHPAPSRLGPEALVTLSSGLP